jgi:hypothetical protein
MGELFADGAISRYRRGGSRFVLNGALKNGSCAPIPVSFVNEYLSGIAVYARFVV